MPAAANSIEGIAEPFLKRIETLNTDLGSLRGSYMSDCKAIRGDIKEVIAEAKDKGVPSKALKQLVRYRELERKQRDLAANLDIDETATFETLVAALGDLATLPLGEAAITKAA
jgi:uncharacterized protein (UPF0335 family)